MRWNPRRTPVVRAAKGFAHVCGLASLGSHAGGRNDGPLAGTCPGVSRQAAAQQRAVPDCSADLLSRLHRRWPGRTRSHRGHAGAPDADALGLAAVLVDRRRRHGLPRRASHFLPDEQPMNTYWLRETELSPSAKNFFALGRADMPRDWTVARDRWERSHLLRAIAAMLGLLLLSVAVAS